MNSINEPSAAFFAKITGRVQGVGFRYYVRSRALPLGITGWVRNMNDGSVEVWAEGEPSSLNAFRQDLKKGSPYSAVRGVIFEEKQPAGYKSFK